MTTTLQEGAPMSSSEEITTGGCPVWLLPRTAECAASARYITRMALVGLLPKRIIDNCGLMISELATNAWKHGLRAEKLRCRHGPLVSSELAIYRRGPASNAEIVITVFDPDPNIEAIPEPAPDVLAAMPDTPPNEPPPRNVVDAVLAQLPATLDDPSMKRGLDTVRACSGGWCGFYRTRSRFGAFPGKAAWFAVSATESEAAQPPTVSMSPAQAVRALKAQVGARGLAHAYCSDERGEPVLFLRHLTVRCRDQTFRWGTGNQARRIPCYDLVEATEQIVTTSQDAEHVGL